MSTQTISTPGGTLNVWTAGTGTPLLFVHGFPLDHRMWQHQLDEFAKTHRVIAPDLAGFGNSHSVSDDHVSLMDDYADDLQIVLDELDVESSVVFCGLSMGGYIAWQFWKKHADRIQGLVLCDTRAIGDDAETKETRQRTARLVLEQGSDPLADMMASKLFSPHVSDDVLAEVRKMIVDASPEGIAAASRGMAERPDITSWLPEIQCPSLLVAGEFDAISTPAEMEEFARHIPHSRFSVIPAAGHMSPLENPHDFNDLLREFLDSLE